MKAVERWNASLQRTLKLLNSGEGILSVNYIDLLFSEKNILPLFDKPGIDAVENIVESLIKARNFVLKKRTQKVTLTVEEFDSVKKHTKINLYDEVKENYNVLNQIK